ncbi:erythromycin esterase family protein [Streptomyces sp. 900105755]
MCAWRDWPRTQDARGPGEASHGTHDFYQARARTTQRLIEEKGFCAVAAEADWPDTYRVNRYVRDRSDDVTAEESLRGFRRFPTWMWRNTAVLDFVGWLREHNDRVSGGERARAGFYGLDLYSLYRSIEEVISYLDRVDPEAAKRARERYGLHCRRQSDRQLDDPQSSAGVEVVAHPTAPVPSRDRPDS